MGLETNVPMSHDCLCRFPLAVTVTLCPDCVLIGGGVVTDALLHEVDVVVVVSAVFVAAVPVADVSCAGVA